MAGHFDEELFTGEGGSVCFVSTQDVHPIIQQASGKGKQTVCVEGVVEATFCRWLRGLEAGRGVVASDRQKVYGEQQRRGTLTRSCLQVRALRAGGGLLRG